MYVSITLFLRSQQTIEQINPLEPWKPEFTDVKKLEFILIIIKEYWIVYFLLYFQCYIVFNFHI